MNGTLMIHLIFKEDVTEKRVEFLTSALEQSDNVRVYDYSKRVIKVLVLNRVKINSEIFAQLASVVGGKVLNNNVSLDKETNNAFLFVDTAQLSVDTSPTANAIQKLF